MDDELVQVAVEEYIALSELLINKTSECVGLDGQLEKVRLLLDFFYIDNIFSIPERVGIKFDARHYSVFDVLSFKTGQSNVLAMLLADFSRTVGFKTELVQAPNTALVRIEVDDNEYIFIEASTGNSLDWPQIQALYQDKLEDGQKEIAVEASLDEDWVRQILISYKSILLTQSDYQKALAVCEALVKSEPDNPYHRRDRGYLLEQLECKPLAVADYRYFVENCPDDPVAKLLKSQLEQNTGFNSDEPTFH
nr:tetratricopeptide repeat protein [Marinifaba aquimaris]